MSVLAETYQLPLLFQLAAVSAGWQRLMPQSPPLFDFVAAEWVACLGRPCLFAMVEGLSRRRRPPQICVAVEVALSGRRQPPRRARPLQNDAAAPERKKLAANCMGKSSFVYIYIPDGSEFCFGWNFIACSRHVCRCSKACCQQLISVSLFQLRILPPLKLLLSEICKQSIRSIQALLAVPAKITKKVLFLFVLSMFISLLTEK